MDGDITYIAGLIFEEWMFNVRGDNHELMPIAKILHGRSARLPVSTTGPLRDPDAILIKDPGVRLGRVLVGGDMSRHLEIIAICDVADCQLLDESCNRRYLVLVCHTVTSKVRYAHGPRRVT